MVSKEVKEISNIPAIILVGGFGKRLKKVLKNEAKPLAPVNGNPFLDIQIQWLRDQGIKKIYLAIYHKAHQFEDFISRNDYSDLDIKLVLEESPLGTGGAAKNVIIKENLKEETFILNGDTLINFNLNKMVKNFYYEKHLNLLLVSKVKHMDRYGGLKIRDNRVVEFIPAGTLHQSGYVFSGLYLGKTDIIREYPKNKFSLDKDLFSVLCSNGDLFAIKGQESCFYDIGTPESYRRLQTKGFVQDFMNL